MECVCFLFLSFLHHFIRPFFLLLQISTLVARQKKRLCLEYRPVIHCGHADESTVSTATEWLGSPTEVRQGQRKWKPWSATPAAYSVAVDTQAGVQACRHSQTWRPIGHDAREQGGKSIEREHPSERSTNEGQQLPSEIFPVGSHVI